MAPQIASFLGGTILETSLNIVIIFTILTSDTSGASTHFTFIKNSILHVCVSQPVMSGKAGPDYV